MTGAPKDTGASMLEGGGKIPWQQQEGRETRGPDAPLVGHDGSAAGPVGARLGQQWSAPGGVAGAGEEVRVEARGGENAPR